MLHTGKPVEVMLAAIEALNLESVKIRVMDPKVGEGWTREYADSIESAYKTYLSMLVKNPDDAEDIMLSKDVDEFWHTHILQTIKYHEDCEAVFGKYLHHQPHIGELGREDLLKRDQAAEKTRRLYEREFGDADSSFVWSGLPVSASGAALSTVAIGPARAALSAAAVRADNASLSAAAIRAGSAALSAAAIRAGNAALSAAAIRPENAALSAAAIRADNAALSAAAIRPENAALSAAAIRADRAALSAAAIRPENAALSAAAIRAGNAALSAAAIVPEHHATGVQQVAA
jgi:hypothetical protein